MSYRTSSPVPSGSVEGVTDARPSVLLVLLVGVLLALAVAGCGGQDQQVRVVEVVKEVPVEVIKEVPVEVIEEVPTIAVFPQHDVQLPTDIDARLLVGQLVVEEGCLRAADKPANYYGRLSVLLVWPHRLTLSTEGGSVRIVDAAGRVAARVGDHVQFSGSGVIDPETSWGREMERKYPFPKPEGCTGPYWLVGDEVTAITLDGPTTLTLHLPDSEIRLRRSEPFLGTPSDYLTVKAVGELVVEDNCLRLKDAEGVIEWPPGFTLHAHRGTVHVRNGAGRIIAQVGDRLVMGGGYSRSGDEKCPGPAFATNSIKVLPDVEVYFPKQDGPLAIDQEMGSFVGRLVLDRRCLKADSVRDRDRVVYPVPPLLIWPDTFTLSTEGEVAGIVDAAGRTVARVGDDVQFSAAAVSYGQAMEGSGLREISPACSGPYWVVADDFTAVPDSGSP